MDLPTPSLLLGAGDFNSWYPGQYKLLEQTLDWYYSPARFLGIAAPTGCHAIGQGILMYDGSIKNVEDVIVGDQLMGMGSQPRIVLSLVRGSGEMFDVVPVKGKSFRVNGDHLLSLICTNLGAKMRPVTGAKGGWVEGEIRDEPVRDVLQYSKSRMHVSKLFRTGVDFAFTAYKPPVSPYVLGLFLSDGCLGGNCPNSVCSNATITPRQFIPELEAEAQHFGLVLRSRRKSGASVLQYSLSLPGGRHHSSRLRNGLKAALQGLGLWGTRSGTKFIPQCYKVAPRRDRLELLAGILDTDGHVERGGYDYLTKSVKLASDVVFLCRSLGLAAYISPCIKGYGAHFRALYYRVYVSGDCSIIPCRFRPASIRMQKKSVLRTGFHLSPAGWGDYYGFVLDGDGRYLLDDFTVTHNSGKTLSTLLLSGLSGARTVILTATIGLQQQYQKDAGPLGGVVVMGQRNFPCVLVPGLQADEGPCHDGVTCSLKEQCPYRIQLRRAKASKLVITNYAYWLAQTNFSDGLGEVGLLVGDEGHQAFGAMENYLTIFLSNMDVQSMGLSFPSQDSEWGVWRNWAEMSTPVAQDRVDGIDQEVKGYRSSGQPIPGHVSRAYRASKSILARLERLMAVTEDWVIQKTYHGYRFVPKWVAAYSDRLFQKVPKVVLMSAILSHRSCDYLGVPNGGQREWVDVPSYFPPENTPIWHIPTARINYRTDDYGSTIWVSRIDQIIQRRLGRKGIIFTVSYERARMLLSRSSFKGIMITHNSGDVVQVVEQFKKMDAPAILVSPSVTTGYDFSMLESGHGTPQYLIVGKLPYPDTKDPVTQARQEDDKSWSSYIAMETLIQECGRASRSATDKSEVLVIDDNIKWFMWQYKDFAPLWFRSRYRGSKQFVPDPLV